MTSIAPSSSPPCCTGCNAGRRQTLQQLAAGDWLVSVDADHPTPLTVADLKTDSKQLIAWPHRARARCRP